MEEVKTIKDSQKDTLQKDISLIRQSYASTHKNKLYQQGETLALAAHWITQHLDVRDEIRVQARQLAGRLAVHSAQYRIHTTPELYPVWLTEYLGILEALMAVVRLGRFSGVIAEVNSLIVERETVRIHKELSIELLRSSDKDYLQIAPVQVSQDKITGLFRESGLRADSARVVGSSYVVATQNQMGTTVAPSTSAHTAAYSQNTTLHGSSKAQDSSQIVNTSTTPIIKKTNLIKDKFLVKDNSKRLSEILEFIKDKKTVAIKDISLSFTDCSEKTILRQINNLLERGLIKKTGEKRWARYHSIV